MVRCFVGFSLGMWLLWIVWYRVRCFGYMLLVFLRVLFSCLVASFGFEVWFVIWIWLCLCAFWFYGGFLAF